MIRIAIDSKTVRFIGSLRPGIDPQCEFVCLMICLGNKESLRCYRRLRRLSGTDASRNAPAFSDLGYGSQSALANNLWNERQ